MSMWGGTNPKDTSELVSGWAIHLRRTPAVQRAMQVAHSTYRPPSEEKKQRSVGRPRRTAPAAPAAPLNYQMPPGYEFAPTGTKRWLNHVYTVHRANPTLSRGQAISKAIMTFDGSANDAWAEDFPYQGLPA